MRVLVTVRGTEHQRGITHDNGVYFEQTGAGYLNVYCKDDKVEDRNKLLAVYIPGFWLSVEYIEDATQEPLKVKRTQNGNSA